jgi:putative (di)nucleoside polyphosphate hydrolase
VPLDSVIEFKREVYQQALNELSDILFRRRQENRYLRQRLQSAVDADTVDSRDHAHIIG